VEKLCSENVIEKKVGSKGPEGEKSKRGASKLIGLKRATERKRREASYAITIRENQKI